jgi:hypothetical protein
MNLWQAPPQPDCAKFRTFIPKIDRIPRFFGVIFAKTPARRLER